MYVFVVPFVTCAYKGMSLSNPLHNLLARSPIPSPPSLVPQTTTQRLRGYAPRRSVFAEVREYLGRPVACGACLWSRVTAARARANRPQHSVRLIRSGAGAAGAAGRDFNGPRNHTRYTLRLQLLSIFFPLPLASWLKLAVLPWKRRPNLSHFLVQRKVFFHS